jgi:glucose-1-phosphate cytidylyltransferase
MLEIGGEPILVHLMTLFAEQGHTEFVLALGYRQSVIRDYFAGNGRGWDITMVDTGLDTDTGDRILRCRPVLREQFFVTYGDGLADVSLHDLLTFHHTQGGLVTITSVPLACQFGVLDMNDTGKIVAFREKPVLREHWINAGFMVLESAVFGHWEGANLERGVLPRLADAGQVYAYRHDGFFKSLDSHKDQQEFDTMLESGAPPWRTNR